MRTGWWKQARTLDRKSRKWG